VPLDQSVGPRAFPRLIEALEIDHVDVAVESERSVGVEHIAMPPLMPAAKLRPARPSTITRPPVMYSQP
jgi:hypothetical protein